MSWVKTLTSSVVGIASEATASGSNWGSLHPDLIVTLSSCDRKGNATGDSVKAVIKEGSMEQQFNWKSPFEDMQVEMLHPNLMLAANGLTSGAVPALMQSLFDVTQGQETATSETGEGGSANGAGGGMSGMLKELVGSLDKFDGRSGITKMNSRQVFAGHSPLKITMTLLFRAWQDPNSEVVKPFQTLQKMAYPKTLAEDHIQAVGGEEMGVDMAIKAIFPSEAPSFVKMTYKGETYPPMVIETIGKPLDAPYSIMGDLWLEVPITLETAHSLDYKDLELARAGALGSLFDEAINAASKALSKLF